MDFTMVKSYQVDVTKEHTATTMIVSIMII
jgi:hypothetical protein